MYLQKKGKTEKGNYFLLLEKSKNALFFFAKGKKQTNGSGNH